MERRRIVVEGLVQGVGFRPFVYREATARGLRGRVCNDAAGVIIDVEGDAILLHEFVQTLQTAAPAHAAITAVRTQPASALSYPSFSITESRVGAAGSTLVSPDIAVCDDCIAELFDPADRRFRYPFLNCTNCGPRFSIHHSLPYDRPRTTMADFEMCAACRNEYVDPSNRRFHAQPIACPDCGPQLFVRGQDQSVYEGEEALATAVAGIRAGLIVAIKGIGGYHLACDATSGRAVQRLRDRKRRAAKPLALMVRDLAAAAQLCEVDAAEAALLQSPARPIVLLRQKLMAGATPEVAPNNPWLGLLLPYSPLHHLLLAELEFPIVLTSGNCTDEPIAIDDADAMQRLGSIADLFLAHNRRIAARCDDSVVRIQNGAPTMVRRSRGYAPLPLKLPRQVRAPVLGVGGFLKNTFCLARADQAFVSQHIGDLHSPLAYTALQENIEQFISLFGATPEVIAYDKHPDYLSTQLALSLSCTTRIAVQHHHAHVAGCVAEHGVDEPVLGVAFDGAGLGDDGAVWGGEFLLVEGGSVQRVAHLNYVPLPGGDAAARHPLRMAAAHLLTTYGPELSGSPIDCSAWFTDHDWRLIRKMVADGLHSPPTSSVGRLFDAVAALCGLARTVSFEGEAACALESAAATDEAGTYRFELQQTGPASIAHCAPVIHAITRDVAAGQPAQRIAARFHNSLAELIVSIALETRKQTGTRHVALSGGVFQNGLLVQRSSAALRRHGFNVLLHRQVPCNDGGLSFGQVAVVAAQLEMC